MTTKESNGYCGYSHCFRPAVAKRGFVKVCAVHQAEPRKWGKDGKTYTGTMWRPNRGLGP